MKRNELDVRVNRILSGVDYGFDDPDKLAVAKTFAANRLDKDVRDLTEQDFVTVAHVYDLMSREAGLWQHIKDWIDSGYVDEWCVFLLPTGECSQPLYKETEDGELAMVDGESVILGECPYKGNWVKQQRCHISMPDPHLSPEEVSLIRTSSAVQKVVAHWNDVRQKAVRLRQEGRVKLLRNEPNIVVAEVKGDHDTYNVVLYRQEDYDKFSVTTWECDCKWGQWAFNRSLYFGRMCSHAYAALMEAQSDLMRGPGSTLWQQKMLDSMKVGVELDDPFEERLGNCYELAFKKLFELHYSKGGVSDPTLVMGSIQGGGNPRIAHAWVEYVDEDIVEQVRARGMEVSDAQLKNIAMVAHDPVVGKTYPVAAYYSLYNAEPERRYTFQEVSQFIVQTGHYGPWEPLRYASAVEADEDVCVFCGEHVDTYDQETGDPLCAVCFDEMLEFAASRILEQGRLGSEFKTLVANLGEEEAHMFLADFVPTEKDAAVIRTNRGEFRISQTEDGRRCLVPIGVESGAKTVRQRIAAVLAESAGQKVTVDTVWFNDSWPITVEGVYKTADGDTYRYTYDIKGDTITHDERGADMRQLIDDERSRIATREFSLAEQEELMNESGVLRNADKLNIEGTHYEEEATAVSDVDDAAMFL